MLENLTPPKRIRSCAVRTILAQLEKKDKEIFVAALANQDWAALTLAKELTSRGLLISDGAISRHRKEICSCSKI
ncbi:hypothetical protein UFOVP692_37 [uncultured Caudovirales phage]|jgi:hypothetical protein|uniref:Uncharacterized protein n=1 Tax=uncultured Caudovirales phage TaxID=2100421 RepID=A0A6J5NFJ9_9CAUD|nr:hypothetical protein UFOVP692_37 [uncultured Caudovirales phage]